jgi:hypothetical protein
MKKYYTVITESGRRGIYCIQYKEVKLTGLVTAGVETAF